MKKYAFLLGLAALATSGFAQPGHHQDQDATILQFGVMNASKIEQVGKNQDAYIRQIGFFNGARIEQEGNQSHMDATILQFGFANYASLKQDGGQYYGGFGNYGRHIRTEGFILQMGMKNLAATKQEMGSEVKIFQFGKGNIVAGVRSHGGGYNPNDRDRHNPLEFRGCRTPFGYHGPHWSIDLCDLRTPYPFASIEVEKFAELKVFQTERSNMFLAMGELEGEIEARQHGYKNIIVLGQEGWRADADLYQRGYRNYIWLDNEDGDAHITQKGAKNLVALELEDGDARIHQFGAYNAVAYYDDICDHCADDPAKFEGDDLRVTQLGFGNKLSLKSTSENADVTVFQMGYKNYATVIQSEHRRH